MRWLLGFLFIAHGVAHLPGFLVDWRLRELPELPYRTTLLGGALNIGDAGMRVVGLLWLLAASWCVTAGVLGRWGLGWGVIALSTLLCVAAWPDTRWGLAMNGALALLLVYLTR